MGASSREKMAASSSHEYYHFTDDGGNDHANFDGRKNDRSQPQHVPTTPHGAMTEILAATGSTSPSSPRNTKHQQTSTKQQNRPSSNPEIEAKKALRLKAAKHFHRGGSSSASAGGVDGTNNKKNNKSSATTTTQLKEIKSPSTVGAIRSSNKYFYPEECSPSATAGNGKELNADDGRNNDKPSSPNMISPSPNNNNSSDTTNSNHQLDKIVEDDPDIEVYESASEIGSGYNSGSDLENAARKILRRRGVGSLTSSYSKPNYDSDDNASDTGSAVSSSASSSFRKLPDGWKDRIKRKAGMPKLPPTMEKKVKPPPSKSNVVQQPQKEQYGQQIQPQQQVLPPKGDAKQQEVPPKEDMDNGDYVNYQDSSGVNQYHNHFSTIAGACEDSDDDEYYQDHFNGNANGAFPSFSNHDNHDDNMDSDVPRDDTLSSILDHPPIYEDHVYGPTKPSTIYESNDEDEQDEKDENDDSLFNDDWNTDHLHLTSLKDNDGGVNADKNVVPPIQEEVDESGFPSPRKTRVHGDVDGLSPITNNRAQKGEEQSEQMIVDERSVDAVGNDFNKDDYFHQFDQDWEHNFLPVPGVEWKTSTKRSTAAAPPLTDDDILATFVDVGDTAVASSAWGDSSFPDNFEAPASPERKELVDETKEGNAKEQQPIAKEGNAQPKLPLRQQEKIKEKVSPAMQPFSDGDLSDLGNDVSDAEAAVGTKTQSKRGLNFFKKKGRRYHSEGERSDSEWDTDTSKNTPRLKALSPLRRKNKQKKNFPKTNETRRKLFGSSPKKTEKKPAPAKKAVSAANPHPASETNLKPTTATPIASNAIKTPDLKPISSVDVDENGATDDKTVSTLGSIITRDTSSKAAARVPSSSASANTATSEIERLRKENDKLRQELERQAARRENERLKQELEKRAANEAASAHPGFNGRSDERFRVKKNSPNGMHKSTLSSLLEGDLKAKQRSSSRRHRVTKNHLMNQADFDDDESITTYSPTRPSRHSDYMSETTGTEILSKVAGATGWVSSQVRNAAQSQARPLDCFTACSRSGRGRMRRRGARGIYDDSESDTDSLEDDSLFRSGGRPRPPIARRRRGNANRKREQFL